MKFYLRYNRVWYDVAIPNLGRKRGSTGLYCEPQHWGNGKPKRNHPHKDVLDVALFSFEREFNTRMNLTQMSIPQIYEEYKMHRLPKLSERTQRVQQMNLDFVIELVKKNPELWDINNLSLRTYDDMLAFGRERGWKAGTTDMLIKTIKTMLNWAYKRKLHVSLEHREWPRQRKYEKQRALSLDEIRMLEIVTPRSHYQVNAKKLWLLLYYTGQRYSDLRALLYAPIRNGLLHLEQSKTRKEVTIKITPKIHMCKDAHLISRVKLGKYIKELCALAHIDNPEQVSTHTARRSFITNALALGANKKAVKEQAGIATWATMDVYDKYRGEDSAKAIAEIEL